MNDASRPDNANTGPDLEAILNTHGGRRGFLRGWRLLILAGLLVALAVAYFQFSGNGQPAAPRYLTQAVSRGELVVKVIATGNLEPTNQVDVGSELSGTVAKVFVDDDDRVTQGQLLAVLDLSSFEDAVAKSRAGVAVAEAKLKQAQATAAEVATRLERYREVARLSDNKVPSKTEMDTTKAELARAEADVASARAGIAEAQATLHADETKLAKAHIRSPINGVVLERSVDPGQAVAASLQAVTLFSLAEDLSKMELKVDVDEADVGQVKAGLKATFSVDAWPNRRFEAVITRVGFNATDDAGVISYPAVLQVDNADLSLRPGMTGTAEITTVTRENALLVPNAALRYSPPATTQGTQQKRSILASLMPRPRHTSSKSAETISEDGSKRVWVLRNGEAVPVQVRTGTTNGRVTEVVGGELHEGDQVITETVESKP